MLGDLISRIQIEKKLTRNYVCPTPNIHCVPSLYSPKIEGKERINALNKQYKNVMR